MSLPNDLSSFHKSNAGIVCYHSAVESLAGTEVSISDALRYRRDGLTAGVAAVKVIDSHVKETECQLLMDAWEIILERGESMDMPLQMRQHAWLNRMSSRYA